MLGMEGIGNPATCSSCITCNVACKKYFQLVLAIIFVAVYTIFGSYLQRVFFLARRDVALLAAVVAVVFAELQ